MGSCGQYHVGPGGGDQSLFDVRASSLIFIYYRMFRNRDVLQVIYFVYAWFYFTTDCLARSRNTIISDRVRAKVNDILKSKTYLRPSRRVRMYGWRREADFFGNCFLLLFINRPWTTAVWDGVPQATVIHTRNTHYRKFVKTFILSRRVIQRRKIGFYRVDTLHLSREVKG